MGLFDFVKNAGASILGMKTDKEKAAEARTDKESKIKAFIGAFDLEIADFGIGFSGEDDEVVVLTGEAANQETKEKVILAVGNIEGVAQVDDQMTVAIQAPEAVFHTVAKGEWLSKIAQKHYGDAGKYNVIFEANKPMLEHPDKIYPGQVLRIPSLDA